MKQIYILLALFLSACTLPQEGYNPLEDYTPLPQPSSTSSLPTQPFTKDPHQITLETAQAEAAAAYATVTAQAVEIEILEKQLELARVTPTKPAPPTPSIPGNVVSVVALHKMNVRRIKEYNKAGAPIMILLDPRIQFNQGETLLVYKAVVIADGGYRFYEIYGPRGAGYFVRAGDIAFP